MALEIPPRYAVLHRNHDGIVLKQGGQFIHDGLKLMRLDVENDQFQSAVMYRLPDARHVPLR